MSGESRELSVVLGGASAVDFVVVTLIKLRRLIAIVSRIGQMIEDAAGGHLYVEVTEQVFWSFRSCTST